MEQSRRLADLLRVTKVTTAQTGAERLLAMIRRDIWTAGDQLPTEKELCERLAVSRSMVREALKMLATLNVVQPMPGHGTFIKIGKPVALELPEAHEMPEAREMFEPNLARLACLRGTAEDFARIEALRDAHAAAHAEGRPVRPIAAGFHVMLAEAAHNGVAVIFMTSMLELLIQRGRRFDHAPDYQAREIDEHRALLAGIRSRDADRAAKMLLRHILESAATYDIPEPERRHRPDARTARSAKPVGRRKQSA